MVSNWRYNNDKKKYYLIGDERGVSDLHDEINIQNAGSSVKTTVDNTDFYDITLDGYQIETSDKGETREDVGTHTSLEDIDLTNINDGNYGQTENTESSIDVSNLNDGDKTTYVEIPPGTTLTFDDGASAFQPHTIWVFFQGQPNAKIILRMHNSDGTVSFQSGELSPNADNDGIFAGFTSGITSRVTQSIENIGTETAYYSGWSGKNDGTVPTNMGNRSFSNGKIISGTITKPFTYVTFEANKTYFIDIGGTDNIYRTSANNIILNTDSIEEKTVKISYTYGSVSANISVIHRIEQTTITTTDKYMIIPLQSSDLSNFNIELSCDIDLNIGRIINKDYRNNEYIPTRIQANVLNLTDVEELNTDYVITGDRVLRHITTHADHSDLTIKAFDENDVELFSDTLDTKAGVEETIGLYAKDISKLTFSEPITIDDIDFVDGGITPHDWIVGIANEQVRFNIGTDLTNAYEILLKTILIDSIGTYNVTLQGISGSTTTDIYVNNSVIGDFEERITFTEFELYKVIISGENINEYSRTFTELPKELKLVILKKAETTTDYVIQTGDKCNSVIQTDDCSPVKIEVFNY